MPGTEQAEHLAVGAVDERGRSPLVSAGIDNVIAKSVGVYHDERNFPEPGWRKHPVSVGRADGLVAVLDVDVADQALDESLELLGTLLLFGCLASDRFGKERDAWIL